MTLQPMQLRQAHRSFHNIFFSESIYILRFCSIRFVGSAVNSFFLCCREGGVGWFVKTRGPYRVEQVHTNGTLTIRRGPGVIDRVNIRRLRPAYLP